MTQPVNAPESEQPQDDGEVQAPPTAEPSKPTAEVVPVVSLTDVPARIADQLALAEAIHRTNLLPPSCRTPQGVLAAMWAAKALQVPLWTAMQEMHEIDGKVGWSVNFVRALVIRAGHKIRVVERTEVKARVRLIRHDDPEPFYGEFTIGQAEKAGLIRRDDKGQAKKGQNWVSYPEAMLVARATTIVVREACPEVLFGSGYTPEELGSDTDEEGTPIVTVTSERVQAAPGGQLSEEDREAIRAGWRQDIAAAETAQDVDVLYKRAQAAKVLDRPLMADGTTVEGALADRVAVLQGLIAQDAAETQSQDPEDTHDADVVEDNHQPPAAPTGEPDDGEVVAGAPVADPDDPQACRNSARRRGVVKLLAERFGDDVDQVIRDEFGGLPIGNVATDRLLALHLRKQKDAGR